jgi:PST family polysaccharide transporter
MQPANQVFIGTVAALVGSNDTLAAGYRLIRRGLVLLVGLGAIMLLGTVALAGVGVDLLVGAAFAPSARMLRELAVMFPLAAFVQVITGYVLVPFRYDRLVTVVSFVGAVVSVVLTLGLGKVFGGDGVAWARSLGFLAMSIALVQIVRREPVLSRVFGGWWPAQRETVPVVELKS